MGAILAIAADTWRSVQAVKYDVGILKTALISKGLIEPGLCSRTPERQDLPDLEAVAAVIYFQEFQKN